MIPNKGLSVSPLPACRCTAEIKSNRPLSQGLLKLDLEVPLGAGFLPGQFAMLNRPGHEAWTFGRPLSILSWHGNLVSFLYRVVGRGTQALAGLGPGQKLTFLGPLGSPFPDDLQGQKAILVAGGVGLPPLHAWWERFSKNGDRAFFGARHGDDVPWPLLGESWQVSLEKNQGSQGHEFSSGLVTAAVSDYMATVADEESRTVLACGPWPLLKAVAGLADHRGWRCFLSLEEHMGCGYGACKGCVVPVRQKSISGGITSRPATCCQEGPVFLASDLVWSELD